jgi:hypothetical protein
MIAVGCRGHGYILLLCRNNRRCMVSQSGYEICAVVRRSLLLYLSDWRKGRSIWKQNLWWIPSRYNINRWMSTNFTWRKTNHNSTSITMAAECGCKVTFTFALSFGRYRCVWIRLWQAWIRMLQWIPSCLNYSLWRWL